MKKPPSNASSASTGPTKEPVALIEPVLTEVLPENKQTPHQLLKQRFQQSAWFQQLSARYLPKSASVEACIENLHNPSIKTLLAVSLCQTLQRPVVLLCADPPSANRYTHMLRQWVSPETSPAVYRYPNEGFSPYDLTVTPVHALRDHYHFLEALKAEQPAIFVLDVRSILLKILPLSERLQYALHMHVGHEVTIETETTRSKMATKGGPDAVLQRALEMGYVSSSLILEPGDISRRGDIVDIYPVSGKPVRMVFFGDTVESIREIDVDSQRSIQSISEVMLLPRSEVVLTPDNIAHLKTHLQQCLQTQQKTLQPIDYEGMAATIENQLSALDQLFHPDGMDYYAPLIHQPYVTLASQFPKSTLWVVDDGHAVLQHLESLTERFEETYRHGVEKGRLLQLITGQEPAFVTEAQTAEAAFQFHVPLQTITKNIFTETHARLFLETLSLSVADPLLETGTGSPQDPLGPRSLVSSVALDLQSPERFNANLLEGVERMAAFRRDGYQVWITTDYPQRVLDICREQDVPALYVGEDALSLTTVQQVQAGRELLIAKQGTSEGFLLPDLQIAHFTDAELFGSRRLSRPVLEGKSGSRRREDVDTIQSIQELRPGDYIVHSKHGIGQFMELTQMRMDGEKREYLTIQYSGSDKLYVPVDQVNLLSRYRGAGEAAPKLSKMGGVEWQSVTKKVKKSIQSVAKELVALYAARAKAVGHAFEPDSPWQVELEQAFPYTETPDQWQAIQDTKGDMESNKPMDRLICGDVGFGKTEVAIRAVFKAVLSGKQVAVLVPTTILAQQHFNTISERFQPYGVKMGLLSRFRSPQEQKEVLRRLSVGECDVVVGTHRLLQKDVLYKDLGLLVIDEEHRFGVTHKEKIKQFRNHIDVLTMSATPIPRTLYMSLSGVREMSLINTPPTNRAPVQTFVGPYNPAQIRMAILHEVDRGGQVYFVHNRVQTIYGVAEALHQLVPEVRIAIGHGQMGEHQLENVMLDFAQQQVDVLLATTIIESGLDIPNANTMIIDRADRFGLAQLYQLRGRVGRSNIQAYAYCYYDPERILTEDAKNRLRAIREFTSLGSGYQIALRDMEIRGVGNVLGAEQHGHMVAIGFDMYCQMLKDTLEAVQDGHEEPPEKPTQAIIDLNVTALIPETWIADRDVKLTEYKRLADIESERALEVLHAEWQDRFGKVPKESLQLIQLVRLRILATQLNIPLVRTDDEFLRITVTYGLQEWMKIQSALPPAAGKKLRWVAGVASKEGSLPTILCRLGSMSGTDQILFLLELFKCLVKIHSAKRA